MEIPSRGHSLIFQRQQMAVLYGLYDGLAHINEQQAEKLNNVIVESGDVLLNITGDSVARVCMVEDEVLPARVNQHVAIVRANKELVLGSYLLYFLQLSKPYLLQLAAGGATRNALTKGMIEDLEIEIPHIQEQKRIVSLIDEIQRKIRVNEEINDNLLQQAQRIFTKEFLTLSNIPNGWQESSLLGIADYLNGLAMQKYRPNYDEEGLPVLKIKELRQGSCDSNSELCSPSIKSEYIVHDGDVIFSWSGSLLVDFWCGGTCGLNQHLFKVTSSSYDKWFYYAWTSHHLQKFVAIATDMATTMGHIKRKELSKAKVLIPSQYDYDRIGGVLAPLYDLLIANRIENRKLSSLRDELLPKLISGEIDVSDIDI